MVLLWECGTRPPPDEETDREVAEVVRVITLLRRLLLELEAPAQMLEASRAASASSSPGSDRLLYRRARNVGCCLEERRLGGLDARGGPRGGAGESVSCEDDGLLLMPAQSPHAEPIPSPMPRFEEDCFAK